jgi:hypothetical protein
MASKASTKHPYAAIEHRVIDSEAYADLTFSARSLLTLMARQLTKDNNGHLQATYSYLRRFGFDSERTVGRAVKELVAHGFVYRTRSGGYQQGAAQYAVTWLSVTRKDGLFMGGFSSCAWREWQPSNKKTPPAKMQETHGKNVRWTPLATDKKAGGTPRKSADNELMPCRGENSVPRNEQMRTRQPRKLESAEAWIPAYLTQLDQSGLSGQHCFQIPLRRTLQ